MKQAANKKMHLTFIPTFIPLCSIKAGDFRRSARDKDKQFGVQNPEMK